MTAGRLPVSQVAEVEKLVSRAARQDGFVALNEAALLALRHGEPVTPDPTPRDPTTRHPVTHAPATHVPATQAPATNSRLTHVLLWASAEVLGYGQLAEDAGTSVAALVVSPDHRGRGLGSALLEAMASHARHPLRIWATGDTPPAQALARSHGLQPLRRLLIMRRPLAERVPAVPPLPGVRLRTFVVGQDEAPWLALNARAFADHPEQGRMSLTDLRQRMAEPWFDPGGFWLAEQGRSLVGFHWTKQHAGRLGEVYVLGVDPVLGLRGLGRVLLAAGLRHLQARGNTHVELYVESDNAPARRLYDGFGFTVASADVMYGELDPGPTIQGVAQPQERNR